MIDPPELILISMEEYCVPIEALMGPGSINSEKKKSWAGSLTAIGWQFDFVAWTVRPKERGLAKMLVGLFIVIPPGAKAVHESKLESVTGLLSWYAEGIPAGNNFVSSLFTSQSRFGKSDQMIRLSEAAIRDLNWWRALIIIACRSPNALAASIDSVRAVLVPSLYFRTDASSTIGGGGYMSLTLGGPRYMSETDSGMRWTLEEMRVFEEMGVSINVLEYFVAIYYVMLWSDECKNKVVHIECDNTAAVAWLVKGRAGRSVFADALAKIFCLFCLKLNITIVSTHIPGVENDIADFKSRDLDFLPQDADEIKSAGGTLRGSTKKESCRRLLLLCIVQAESMDTQKLLMVLTELLSNRGRSSVSLSV